MARSFVCFTVICLAFLSLPGFFPSSVEALYVGGIRTNETTSSTASAETTVPALPTSSAPTVSAATSATEPAVPWDVLLALAVLVAALFLLWFEIRRQFRT